MSHKESISSNYSKKTVWEALHWLFCDPKRLIRVMILTTCTFIVVFQLTKCIKKLVSPPVTTHAQFELNQTLRYPAVTLCRNPPFKEDVLEEKYKLDKHPTWTQWDDFPFENYTLQDMFEEATYNIDDFFVMDFTGLDGDHENIEIISSFHLIYGQCHTIKPLVETKYAGRTVGYQIFLKHDLDVNASIFPLENPPQRPGWHVFIHDANEKFVENRIHNSGRIEYLYVDVREKVEIKLQTQHLTKITSVEKPCTNDPKFSGIKCGGVCNWAKVSEKHNCSGPWMPDIMLQECRDSNSTKELITSYLHDAQLTSISSCGCLDPCCSIIFSVYVMSRQEVEIHEDEFYALIFIYYSTNVVSVIEEKFSYDLTQFVADMGGSIGFLLGLSVIGLIAAVENVLAFIFLRRLPIEKNNKMLTSGKPIIDGDTDSIYTIQANEGEEGKVVACRAKHY